MPFGSRQSAVGLYSEASLHAVAVADFRRCRGEVGGGGLRRLRPFDGSGAGHARDDRREIGIADHLLAIGVLDDGAVDLVERAAIQRAAADLLAALLHRVAP